MHGSGRCAAGECPCGGVEGDEVGAGGSIAARGACTSSVAPPRSLNSRTAPPGSRSRRRSPNRCTPSRTACRLSLPELLLRSIAQAAKELAAAVLARGRLRIVQAKRRSPCRFEGGAHGGGLTAEVCMDGGQAGAACADVELDLLLRSERPKDAAREEAETRQR